VPEGGAAARLLEETGVGLVAPEDDADAIRAALVELHRRWRGGNLDVELTPELRERVSRRTRVAELAQLLRDVTAQA
jgi:hypothetical protein